MKHPKPEHGSLEWLTLRHRDEQGRIRFGASEAPVLMGASSYRTVADLALEKWADPEVKPQSDAMLRGHLLEPALIQYASQILGVTVETPEEMWSEGRLIATLDGLTPDGLTIVEAKTTTKYSSDSPLPAEWYWQVLAQMICVPEAERAVVVVLDRFQRLGHWVVEREQCKADMAMLIIQSEDVGDALDEHRIPDGTPLTEAHIKAMYPTPKGSIELGAVGITLVSQWLSAKQAKETAEQMEKDARDALTVMLGEYEIGTVDGQQIVSYKTRNLGSRLDTKALEADHPDLVAKYKKPSGSTRVLKALEG